MKTLLLLTRKAVAHFKLSLMGHSNRIIEHSSAESHVYFNGPAQEFQRRMLVSGLKTILVIFEQRM